MKTIVNATLVGCFCVAFANASDQTAYTQPRRAPYKEVRTKQNRDPQVREALRLKSQMERKRLEDHRKQISGAATYATVPKVNVKRTGEDTNTATGWKAAVVPPPVDKLKKTKE